MDTKEQRDMYEAMVRVHDLLFRLGKVTSVLNAKDNHRLAKELTELCFQYEPGYKPPKAKS